MILKEAEPITRHEFHYMFLQLPCFVTGQILQENKLHNYVLNAGSWIKITTIDTTLFYGSLERHITEKWLVKSPVIHTG